MHKEQVKSQQQGGKTGNQKPWVQATLLNFAWTHELFLGRADSKWFSYGEIKDGGFGLLHKKWDFTVWVQQTADMK